MAELRRCPFCGGGAKLYGDTECWGHGEYVRFAAVKCGDCGAQGERFYNRDCLDMDDSAVAAWNRRAEDDDLK